MLSHSYLRNMLQWVLTNRIEFTGTLLGLLYIWLEIKGHIGLWPVGILMSAFYIYIFYSSKLYADMGLQFYYLIVSIYGWLIWLTGRSNKNDKKELLITHCSFKMALYLILIAIPLYGLIAWLLVSFTDSPVPYCDSFPTTLSIIATFMLTRKIIEQWIIWIVVNIASMSLYIYRGLNLTAGLYLIYAILAIIGYIKWKSEIQQENN